MLYRHMFALLVLGFLPPFLMLVVVSSERNDLEERLKQPTYHCDGSETRGFAEPGSPEASACWFEVKK